MLERILHNYNNEVLNQASKAKGEYENCAVSRNVTVFMIIFGHNFLQSIISVLQKQVEWTNG